MRVLQALFLVMTTAVFAMAAPPDVPKILPAKPGELVTLTVKGKDVCYQPSFADTDVFFARLHADDADTLSFVVQVKANRDVSAPLVVFFWTQGEKKGAYTRLDPTGKPTAPPGTDPPTDPPPVAGVKFFGIVRAEGPSSPAWSALMKAPEWKAVTDKGHAWKEYTVSEADAAGIKLPANTALPCVLTFVVRENGVYIQIGDPKPAPKTAVDVLKLLD